MPEMTPSTRELARRIGVTETALRKAEAKGRIEREPDGQWDVEKSRRRMIETADPVRSPLAGAVGAGTTQAGLSGDATPYARLRVAQLALKVEAQRMAPAISSIAALAVAASSSRPFSSSSARRWASTLSASWATRSRA